MLNHPQLKRPVRSQKTPITHRNSVHVPQLNDCLPEDTIFRYPIRHGLVCWRTEVVPIALLRLGIPCWGEVEDWGYRSAASLQVDSAYLRWVGPPFLQTPSPHFNCMSSFQALVQDLASLVALFFTKTSGCYCAWTFVICCRSLMIAFCFWRPVKSKSPAK
jgi:hypothetical protein